MATHNIFTLSNNNAAFVTITGVQITFEHAVDRPEFLAQFNIPNADSISQISYEPTRNLYHIIDDAFNVTALDSPSENEATSFVSNNFEAIKSWFEQDYALQLAVKESNEEPQEVPVLG